MLFLFPERSHLISCSLFFGKWNDYSIAALSGLLCLMLLKTTSLHWVVGLWFHLLGNWDARCWHTSFVLGWHSIEKPFVTMKVASHSKCEEMLVHSTSDHHQQNQIHPGMLIASKIQQSPALTVCKGVASTAHVDECVTVVDFGAPMIHLSRQSWRKQTFYIRSQISIKFGASINPCHQTNVSSCESMRIAFARQMIQIKCYNLMLITTCWLFMSCLIISAMIWAQKEHAPFRWYKAKSITCMHQLLLTLMMELLLWFVLVCSFHC